MEHDVETEERKGKKIKTEVQNWLTKVDQLTKEADDLNRKHLAQTKCLPNLKLRHHLSRKSTKLVLEVAGLLEKKNIPDQIAYVAKPEDMCIQDYEAFDSRTSTAMAVINILRNSNTYMIIGVYGIGGVGKTTLVKEVNYQLATSGEKLFDEVVMIRDLKHDPSIERIQKEIAEKLGLELPENGTPAGRARLISNRIKDKKTLVILDDVWESIDLEAVGLPRMATLKILLTSRTKLVLAQDMGTQKEFPLEVLNEEETWRLFQKMAGDIVEDPDIQTIASQVAERCGGLPLLIVTVARSLKDSPLYDWKDALRRLKNFDGKGLEEQTYAAIEWSYDKLKGEELKSVFLLCASEVGSANDVYILDLLKYSMGLGFIKDVETMEEARNALHSLLKKLQQSCLLLDTGNNKWVSIHDLVKHVAKRIAARHHHVLSVSHGSELKEWPDMEFREKCTSISSKYCQTLELPEVLQCPELTMLALFGDDDDSLREIPSNFFKEMKKLKVLDLTSWSIASLPPSLKFLKDLQTLCLDQCTLEDIALVGELQNLKILSFLQSKFKKLPEEIGQLTRLRLLDLTDCSQLEVISPDVISKLKRLEELRMGKNSFNKWEAGRVGETKRSNASLEELTCLPRLTALHIHIPDATILPANLFTTSKLERFQICIGSVWKWDDVDEALNALKLKLTSYNELDQGLKMLLKKTQDLYVEGMEDVNDKFFRELATGGYQQLKHLHVQNNAKFAYTISEKVGFLNLTWLAVSELKSLRFLLSSSMARSLSQVKRLQISGCQFMEVGIPELKNPCTPNEQFLFLLDKDSFPNLLQSLGFRITENWDSPPLHLLRNLQRLASYAHTNSSLNSLEQLLGLEKVNGEIHAAGDATFPFLRELYLCGMRKLMNLGDDSLGPARLYFPKVEILELEDCDSLHNLRSSAISFNYLTTLQVIRCKGLKYLTSISMAKSLMQLTKLEVRDCEEMIEIVASSGNDVARNEIEFKMLKHLELSALPSLKGFCSGTHTVKFPSLENLLMSGCTQLEGFILDITTDKNRLGNEIEDIESARLMQRFLFDNKVELPKLTRLTLKGLTKLTTIWNKQIQNTSAAPFDCGTLEYVEIDSCENLENIFPLWVARNLQQLQTLGVTNCGVKEIVAGEERLQTVFKFVFPKVTRVLFGDLSQLVNFYPGMHVCSWPLLNDLRVFECDKVDIFAEEFSSFQEKLDGNSSSTLINRQFLFSIEKDSFPNLERLGLNAMEFSNGPLPAAAQFFGKLKILAVSCPESKSLVFLDKLLLDPEGSSTASAVGITTQQFPHLKELKLVRMKKLMHLGQDDEEDSSQSATRIPNIPNLQFLFANGCHSLRNLRSSAISFDNLTTLQVSVCNRLEYLITYSMANSLTQLTTLEVEGCPRLVQIVGSNDEDDSRNEITLPRLKHLKLSVLPRLQSFCSGNCLAKLPSLETSTMSNRLKLKIFAADDQTLQLITNEGDDTDVEFWDSTAPNCSSPLKWMIVQQRLRTKIKIW
ncbi:hypothetical protein ACLB2K_024871 [Fragaria x ananassa]